MILCDFHTHSDNSFDAESSVDEMCRAAISRGISAIAITDHCEAPYINLGENCEFGSFDRQIPKSVKDALAAKTKYEGKLKVLCGVELGEPMHDPEQTAHALKYADFDFILASVHNLRNRDDFYYMDYSKVDVDEILAEYFSELAETASFEHFDSLSHLTYPLRYIFERTGVFPDLTKHMSQIENIFNILIKNKKALEINVSGLYQPVKTTLPHQELINLFHSMGGEYVTIGTDAHIADRVGVGIEKGILAAKNAGFKHYSVYEKHNPILIEIE
ncbi:MAG: histidinol-phosphatase HisJ family protein [Clostridia bacterium]|nr:histidinol-phosphatase HisJ family protein [Clostridia bacterium]